MDPFPLILNIISPAQVVDPTCYLGSTAPLPIELKYFDAFLNEEQEVELATSSEIDTKNFEIIRQQDGDVTVITRVSYYKLRSVDLDGAEQNSDWHAIEIKEVEIEHIKIYPNPAIYDFNLVLTTSKSRNANFRNV